MSIKEIRQNALGIYKKHRLNSWVLSIICGLFIAALLLIGILSELFYIVIIPLVVLPFFFSCFVAHLGLIHKDELTARNLFRGYGIFFSQPYRSSFSVIKSFLKTLLVELAVSGAVLGICYAIYSQSETFTVTINEIIEQLANQTLTTESLQALLEANDSEVYNYVNITNAISFLLGCFAFIIFITRESISIYPRLNMRNVPLAHQIARASIRVNYKRFNKAYFALNWPLLLILLGGMVGGLLLSVYAFDNYAIAGVLGLVFAIALSSVYLPFFFANNEAIFESLAVDLNSVSEEYVKEVFSKYGVELEDSPKKEEQEVVEGDKKDPDDTGPNK